MPQVIGGRYGLSSKEFTPAMVKAVFDELAKPRFEEPLHHRHPRRRHPHEPRLRSRFLHGRARDSRALFYGLGSDGTVGANKNSIKIIGAETPNYAQGYFVYDSKKSGSVDYLAPALRPGSDPLQLPDHARRTSLPATTSASSNAWTCSKPAAPGAVFLLNSPYQRGGVWQHLPRTAQQQIIEKKLSSL